MRISLTGSGVLAGAYLKINPSAKVLSFFNRDVVLSSDVIIHNAAFLPGNDLDRMMDNFKLTKRIVDKVLAVKPNIKFINIGSMSFLSNDGYLPVNKMSPYAYSKFLSEIYVMMFLPNMKSVRFSTIFYKNPQKDGLSELIYRAKMEGKITLINGGSAKRDFIPLDIAAQYLDYIVKEDTPPVINICSGIETSFLQVAEIILKYTKAELVFEERDTPEVLSKFVKSLPEIKFSLEDKIRNYLCEL